MSVQRILFDKKITKFRLISLLLILLLILCERAVGQTVIELKNKSNGQAVSGVIVSGQGAGANESFNDISDEQGIISFEGLTFPVKLSTSHLSFEVQNLTVNQSGHYTMMLELTTLSLEQVIITGQHEPQSIDESVFNVQVIDKRQIEDQGAVDLADVLSNQVNVVLTPNKESGRTSISLLGLGAEYVKILVDGIPFVSTEGNGNNVDISQINLNTIEQIEIVEGPMAVNYGSNAAAGVINLITKKSAEKSITIQEETVGPEYGLNSGRHIQSINIGHYVTDNFLVRLDFRRNDFGGLQGDFAGEDHLIDDNRRGFDWRPKIQYSGGFYAAYHTDKFKSAYRFSRFYQQLSVFSSQVFLDLHVPTQTTNPFAFDQLNETNRFLHQFNISSNIGRVNFNVVSAYTGVELFSETFRRRLLTDVNEETIDENNSFLNSVTSRGTFNNFIDHEKYSLEIGYEYTNESLKQNFLSQSAEGQETETKKGIENYAVFSSLEWGITEKLSLRPGLRYIYNSRYSAPLTYSLNVKYQLAKDFDVRGSVGRSYRTPTLTELFLFFVDANHDVRGNENLLPEDIFGTFFTVRKVTDFAQFRLISSFTAYYNDVSDRISLALVNPEPAQFQYINIDEFQSKGIRINNAISYGKFNLKSAFSYNGRRRSLSAVENGPDDFLYSTEFNLNTSYDLIPNKLKLSVFYKRTGRDEQFRLDDVAPDGFVKGQIDAFNQMDFTSNWQLTKGLQLAGGIKNIFNVTDVNSSVQSAGTHSPAPTSVGRSYGRSYFLRANYTFK